MLCEICHTKEAELHYAVVIGGTTTLVFICEECAKKRSLVPVSGSPLSELLLNNKNKDIICSGCGLRYEEFTEMLKFGCSNCYDRFGEEIKPFLERLQGGIKHKGREPEKGDRKRVKQRKRVIELKKALKDAVRKEEYETAGRIRDEIIKLEDAD